MSTSLHGVVIVHDATKGPDSHMVECLGCGGTQRFALPINISVYIAAAEEFARLHESCVFEKCLAEIAELRHPEFRHNGQFQSESFDLMQEWLTSGIASRKWTEEICGFTGETLDGDRIALATGEVILWSSDANDGEGGFVQDGQINLETGEWE